MSYLVLKQPVEKSFEFNYNMTLGFIDLLRASSQTIFTPQTYGHNEYLRQGFL